MKPSVLKHLQAIEDFCKGTMQPTLQNKISTSDIRNRVTLQAKQNFMPIHPNMFSFTIVFSSFLLYAFYIPCCTCKEKNIFFSLGYFTLKGRNITIWYQKNRHYALMLLVNSYCKSCVEINSRYQKAV